MRRSSISAGCCVIFKEPHFGLNWCVCVNTCRESLPLCQCNIMGGDKTLKGKDSSLSPFIALCCSRSRRRCQALIDAVLLISKIFCRFFGMIQMFFFD